jgi:hypothetical protein
MFLNKRQLEKFLQTLVPDIKRAEINYVHAMVAGVGALFTTSLFCTLIKPPVDDKPVRWWTSQYDGPCNQSSDTRECGQEHPYAADQNDDGVIEFKEFTVAVKVGRCTLTPPDP